ncbi:ankyrin protein [Fusarium bulbicola]|nr:ankyrin protein [Fusarium bulbicola]
MEPVGLAVGLVGRFSTCMDVMQRVDSYRTAGRDSRQLGAQLNATMHLFERWGDGVGISQGKLSDSHHPDLDNARTFAVVQGLLNSIMDFSATSNEPPSPNGPQKTPSFPTSGDLASHGSKISRWQKTAWALRGKLKQTGHVQALAGLISDLYNVVIPGTAGSKASNRNPTFKDLSINPTPQPYAEEIRELLQKIEEEMEGKCFTCQDQLFRLTLVAEKIRDLHLWLGAPTPNDLFSDSNDKRVEETCEWILRRDEFLEWQKPCSSSELLWIKGPAGFGKTVLCAKIVQELERTAQGPVAYFFLSSRYDGRDDPFSAIRAWLTMMIQRNSVARDIVTKTRLSQHEPLASQAAILQAFHEVIVGVPGCILVLDGLDECTGMTNADTKSVPHFLLQLKKAISDTAAKILISSRGYSEYTISPDDVGPDLIAYSSEIVRAKLPNKDEPTRASIARKMRDKSEGQFQWVKLQEGRLDSLYDREWTRVNAMGDSDKLRALSLLQWTAFAVMPLTMYQITEAVLITDDMDELPLDEMPDCVDQDYVDSMILELCGSLIEVRRVSPSESTESPEHIHESEEDSIGLQEVHLSHFSVKEYLLLKTFPGTNALLSNEKLRVSNQEFHNTTLAKHCLRFMNLRGVFEGLEMNKFQESGKQHFVSYAVRYTYKHCRDVKAIDRELHQMIIASIDGRNNNWTFVKEMIETEIFGGDPDLQDHSISPFLLVIGSEITEAVAHFIREKSFDMNDRSCGDSTPLFWACGFGNKDIVELLVDNGADINASCSGGRTPLQFSVEAECWGIVKFLTSKGANVSMVDNKRQTPLNLASKSGNTEATLQLIDSGADVSHESTGGFTPLSMASIRGHIEFAKLLIKRGADINQVDGNGHLPLLLAVWCNQPELAELLIDEGAELEELDHEGNTFSLLVVAAGKGHPNMVKALIRKGFNPTEAQPLLLAASYGGYCGFPSDFDAKEAAESPDFPRLGYRHVLELLLQSGADVNTNDMDGTTPLHVASLRGFTDIVEILLQKGAEMNVKTVAGQTPLHYSSGMGHFRVSQLLIQHGADVGSKDNCGRNALHHACCSGDLVVMNLIIASSQIQTLDEADHWGSTPLSLAARFGEAGILSALIDTGVVEIESSDKFGRTTRWWATSRNHGAVTRLLAGTDAHQDPRTDAEEAETVGEEGLETEIHFSSLLTTLLAGSMVSAKYTTKIPHDAVWVTNWDELHAAPRFEGVLLPKHGGFVIEVDEKIVLATDEHMSKEVLDLLTDLENNGPQPEDEHTTPNKRDLQVRGYGNICSHPPCFGPGLCSQYSHCHVCAGLTGVVFKRGRCI